MDTFKQIMRYNGKYVCVFVGLVHTHRSRKLVYLCGCGVLPW